LNTELAARVEEFFVPASQAVAARVPDVGYLAVFLGYTLLGVLVAGFWASRRRAEPLPWLLCAAFLLLLSLGPFAVLGGVRIPLPGYVIQSLPGFSGTTNHWRWSLPATFCLVLAASIGLRDLRRCSERVGRWVLPVVLGLHLLEVALLHPFPRVKPAWEPRPVPAALLVQYLEDVDVVLDASGCAQLNQMAHGKAILGGVLPRIDAEAVRASRRIWRELEVRETLREQLQYLGGLGVDAVIVDSDRVALIRPDPRRPGSFRGHWLRAGASRAAGPATATELLSPSETASGCGGVPGEAPATRGSESGVSSREAS
jgi:hypothetical protein